MRFARIPLTALLAASLAAQQKEPLRLRVESRLVLVDLLATDAEGRPVTDLRREEVELSEDGVRRPLAAFERIGAREVSGRAGLSSEGPAPAEAPAAPAAVRMRRVPLAILVDLDSIAPGHLPQVKAAIARQLKAAGGGTGRFLLATLRNGLHVPVPFSEDLALLLKALDQVNAAAVEDASLLRFAEDLENILVETESAMLQDADIRKVFTSRTVRLAREYTLREEESVRASCAGARALVDELAPLPGRKNLAFYSSGRRMNFAVAARDLILRRMDEKWATDVSKEMSELKLLVRSQITGLGTGTKGQSHFDSLLDAANRARVSFYSVDARGLIAPDDARFRLFTNAQATAYREEINQPQAWLRDLAAGTGGRWFLNRNDLESGLEGARQDAGAHYEAAFAPGRESRPGTLHRITLRSLRPGVRLDYRKSYVEEEGSDPERRAIENAFRFPGLFRDFEFETDTAFVSGDLKVDVYVPTRALRFNREGEKRRCELAVHIALFDGGGGMVGGKALFSRSYNLDLTEERYKQVTRSDNLTASWRGRIGSGSYRLRVVVRQIPSALVAALERRLTVS